MTNPFPPEDHDLDTAITSAFNDLSSTTAGEDDYEQIVNQISSLYKLRNEQNKLNLELYIFDAKHTLDVDQMEQQLDREALPFHKRVDPNTVLTVAGNIFIGIAVIKYEQTGVISSKVMSFMRKI